MKTTHTHHIVPRHSGGTNDSSNLVELTLEEHAEAHRLLYEQHGKLEDKMAWLLLSGKTEEGEAVRRELASLSLKEKWKNDRDTMLSYCSGHERTPEQRERYRAAQTGRRYVYKPRPSMTGNQNARGMTYTHTEQAKRRIAEARRGKRHSQEAIEKMAQNRTGKGCGERNGMSDPTNRAKVAASKVGRKLHLGPNGERKLFIPGQAPDGFTQVS